MGKITFIEIKSELGAGTRGASLGIDALKIEGYRIGNPLFTRVPCIEVPTHNDLLYEKIETPFAKYLSGILDVYYHSTYTITETIKSGVMPIIISGDHSVAGGTIAGLKNAYPEDRIGVVWIDAHADLHTPYTTPSGNVHGMPLAMALNEDDLHFQRNEVVGETKRLWEAIKSVAPAPWIQPEDLVFVGLRDVEPEERYLIKEKNIANYSVPFCRKYGLKKVAEEILEKLDHCKTIYISFDVDSMDPEQVSHGTGTPVPSGFYSEEAALLVSELFKSNKIGCFEVTEINPTLDNKGNRMAATAFHILNLVVEKMEEGA